MARKENKKPEPPPPSSSDPNNNSESESDPEDSDSDVVSSSSSDSAPPTTTTIKRTLTPHPTKQPDSQPKPESESESESDSDDDTPPPPPKPTTTTKQPRSKPLTPKRPAQSDNNKPVPDKRPKKDTTTTAGPSAATTSATPQKALFQRLWSDEDEIVILKGMIEYKEKKGVDPMTHVDDFLDFIKKSLHVADANKTQINSKVRRLKKRFINAQKKKLTDPHEITAFELSKKIWRGVEEVDEVNHRENGVTLAVVSKEEKKGSGNVNVSVNVGVEEVELGFLGEEKEMVKAAMRKMGDGERKEMRKMVEKANVAYLNGFLLKLKVLEVAAKKNLERIRNE